MGKTLRIHLKEGLILVAALFLLFNPVSSKANPLTFLLDYNFNGATPNGSLTAIFDDTVAGLPANTIQLTMLNNLVAPEFIGGNANASKPFGWGFNFNPSKSFPTFSFKSALSTGLEATAISMGQNAFQIEGDGDFDIVFNWGPKKAYRFLPTQTVVYWVTLAGINPQDFNFLSEKETGKEQFYSAAKVQGIPPNDGSGEFGVKVPEPGILILLGLSMTAIGIASRYIGKI